MKKFVLCGCIDEQEYEDMKDAARENLSEDQLKEEREYVRGPAPFFEKVDDGEDGGGDIPAL